MVSETMLNQIRNRIPTKDSDGQPNGWLLPIWHSDDGPQIDQVYLTVVEPGKSKGPHLHMKRRGLFTCIRGNVSIVMRLSDGAYRTQHTGSGNGFITVEVPPGVPAQIRNDGLDDAYVLNMPSPPWRPDDQDEWPMDDWKP